MKVLLILYTLIFSSSVLVYDTVNVSSLTIKVNKLQNSTGVVQFTIYNIDGSIPDEHYKNFYKQLNAEILNNTSTITFEDLPHGEYAINILHDEDEDGVIKKGWFLPIEGIGFSNFSSLNPLNRPSFKKSKFNLNADKAIEVKIIYM
ncbi:MAG: hypothetical protein COA49_09870 [Bacteroidetes bacterium]|nr:MAG: hypothetical protein COA49_09870 [Bacteroidota bacterium]